MWLGTDEIGQCRIHAFHNLIVCRIHAFHNLIVYGRGCLHSRWTFPTLLKGTTYVFRDLMQTKHLIVWAILAGALIFRMGIPRPKVKQLVMRSIGPRPESDPNEAWHPYTRRRSDLDCYIGFYRSVLNLNSLEKSENLFTALPACGMYR